MSHCLPARRTILAFAAVAVACGRPAETRAPEPAEAPERAPSTVAPQGPSLPARETPAARRSPSSERTLPLRSGPASPPFPEEPRRGTDSESRAAAPAGAPVSDETALHRAGEQAQDCYETAVRADLPGDAAGALAFRVTIAPDGRVRRVVLDRAASTASLAGDSFERCVAEALRRQRFRAEVGAAEDRALEVPLKFEPVPTPPR